MCFLVLSQADWSRSELHLVRTQEPQQIPGISDDFASLRQPFGATRWASLGHPGGADERGRGNLLLVLWVLAVPSSWNVSLWDDSFLEIYSVYIPIEEVIYIYIHVYLMYLYMLDLDSFSCISKGQNMLFVDCSCFFIGEVNSLCFDGFSDQHLRQVLQHSCSAPVWVAIFALRHEALNQFWSMASMLELSIQQVAVLFCVMLNLKSIRNVWKEKRSWSSQWYILIYLDLSCGTTYGLYSGGPGCSWRSLMFLGGASCIEFNGSKSATVKLLRSQSLSLEPCLGQSCPIRSRRSVAVRQWNTLWLCYQVSTQWWFQNWISIHEFAESTCKPWHPRCPRMGRIAVRCCIDPSRLKMIKIDDAFLRNCMYDMCRVLQSVLTFLIKYLDY